MLIHTQQNQIASQVTGTIDPNLLRTNEDMFNATLDEYESRAIEALAKEHTNNMLDLHGEDLNPQMMTPQERQRVIDRVGHIPEHWPRYGSMPQPTPQGLMVPEEWEKDPIWMGNEEVMETLGKDGSSD